MVDELIEMANAGMRKKNPEYIDRPAARLPLNMVSKAIASKSFFHKHKGGWKWIIPFEDGTGIVVPITPDCSVDILNKEALQSDLKEFIDEAAQQKENHINQQNVLLEQMRNLSKE